MRLSGLAVLALAASGLSAQESKKEPKQELVVEIECTVPGKRTPRDPTAGPEPYELSGHSVAWRVLGQRFDDEKSLQTFLAKIASDSTHRIPDPDAQGATKLLPVRFRAGAHVCCQHVMKALDLTLAAGFYEIDLFALTGLPALVLPVVNKTAEPETALPTSVYAVPILPEDPRAWNPEIRIEQNGDLRIGGQQLAKPSSPKAREEFHNSLEALKATARRHDAISIETRVPVGEKAEPRDVELVSRWVYFHIDRWTEWREIVPILQEFTQPEFGFWKLRILCRAPQRISEPSAPAPAERK